MKVSLRDLLPEARKNNYAIAGFNIFSIPWAQAVIQAATELKLPVIIMTNKACIDAYAPVLIGLPLPPCRNAKRSVCVHLDHCLDYKRIQEAIDYGFSSVMYDGLLLAYEESLENTFSVVTLTHNKGVPMKLH